MKPDILITIITTAIVSIFIWEAFRSIYIKWFREEPIKHYQPERHEYPKKEVNQAWIDECSEVTLKMEKQLLHKDCECDCAGECKPQHNGKLEGDVVIGVEKGCVVLASVDTLKDFVYNECRGHIPIEHYMSRHNRRYFRGDNVKVVVTVEETDPCMSCSGNEESNCCGAAIIHGDICSECGEHTDSRCEECEVKGGRE